MALSEVSKYAVQSTLAHLRQSYLLYSDRQPKHTHSDNVATTLGRKAFGEIGDEDND